MSDPSEVPAGHRIVTFERLEIIARKSYGPGTYPVPDEVADYVERRRRPAQPILGNQPAQMTVTGNTDDDEKLLAMGIRDVSVLAGLTAEEIHARIPDLTPVGAARVAERANPNQSPKAE